MEAGKKRIMKELPEGGKTSVLAFAGKFKYLTALGCVLSGISAVLALFPYLFIWLVIKAAILTWPDMADSGQMIRYSWLAVGSSLLSMLVYFAGLICTHLSAFRTATNLKTVALHKMSRLPVGYFTRMGSGKLRRMIDDGAGLTETYLAHQLPDTAGALVTPAAVIVILLVFDWRFGLISLLPMALGFVFLFRMMGPAMEMAMKEYQTALEDMNNEAVEYVRGIPVVKTFQQSIFSFRTFHEAILRYSDWAIKYAHSLRLLMCGYTTSINGLFAVLIPAGIILAGDISRGEAYTACVLDLLFYIMFTPICVSMMNKLMNAGENTMKAKDAVRRIVEIAMTEPLAEPSYPKRPQAMDVEFSNVTFSYGTDGDNDQRPALSRVSFTINEGSMTALVGPSGGGKTTAARLIPRFFDVTSGAIRIGGVDVRDMAAEELMSEVGFVFQNSNLFKKSILDNIRAARPDAPMAEVKAAVKAAGCEDIIAKMPAGMDTVIGTKGVYLSGGECQRLALCRAILKDAPIIILDEASAFADPDNEYEILKAFEELARGKTVLMIAHRLSAVCHADQILVLDQGQIKESGTHSELLEKHGMYTAMWKDYQASAAWKVGGKDE